MAPVIIGSFLWDVPIEPVVKKAKAGKKKAPNITSRKHDIRVLFTKATENTDGNSDMACSCSTNIEVTELE